MFIAAPLYVPAFIAILVDGRLLISKKERCGREYLQAGEPGFPKK
jgi:hypothetical protein